LKQFSAKDIENFTAAQKSKWKWAIMYAPRLSAYPL
jgi:hypothetical protein